MNADRHELRTCASAFIFVYIWAVTACAPTSTPTPFRPPTVNASSQTLSTLTPVPTAIQPTVHPTAVTPVTPTACTDGLTFVADLTIEDGTAVSPNTRIDKQWSVTNSGTCNWDSRYRLKWAGGEPLGAPIEQALYPARAGTQITLQIIFTAPADSGTYQSWWQAYGPDGIAFGDPLSINIVVQP